MIERFFEGLEQLAVFCERQVGISEGAVEALSSVSAEVMYEHAHRIYGDQQKLAPLAESTQEARAAAGYSPDEPLLMDGRLLRASLEKAHAGGVAGVGSAEMIHFYHEYGYYNARAGRLVPPRPVISIMMMESAPVIGELMEEAAGIMLGEHATLKVLV